MSTGDTAVRDLLDGLLDEAVLALEANPEADAPPERRYVAHGVATPDCDQLTVSLTRLVPKLLADPRQGRCTIIHTAVLEVRLWRCWPVGTEKDPIPSADTIGTAARQLSVDAWAMWKGMTRAWREGSWPVGVPCQQVKWGTLDPLPAQGALAGYRFDVTVQL